MLRQRVLTALVLLLILSAVLLSPWPLSLPLFLALISALAAWEWLRMTSFRSPWVGVAGGVLVFLLLSLEAFRWQDRAAELTLFHVSILASSFVWLLLVPFKLKRGPVEPGPGLVLWGLFVPICLYATWGSLVIWFEQSGIWTMLSVLILVWIADVFAYFGGKAWGKHKLAPAISPGKTREGAYVGLLGVVIWMLISVQISDSYAEMVFNRYGWIGLILVGLLLGSVSIMGDLYESLLKRQIKIKDSSGLLPGHGGVYDRIDAVVAVVPLAYVIVHPILF